MPTLPPYPPILTQADWAKKKGLVAKIAAPTELGEKLKAVETAYKEVPWQMVFAGVSDAAPLKNLDERIFKIKQDFKGKYDVLEDALDKAKTLAHKVKDDWGKIKLLPKESKTHIENVCKAIDPYWGAIDTQVKAGFKLVTDTRAKAATKRPEEAEDRQKDVGTKIIAQQAKVTPKVKGREVAIAPPKFSIKPNAPMTANKPKQAEASESESEE